MSSKKERIVTISLFGSDKDGVGQIYVDDNRFTDQIIKFPNCFKNPERYSEFIKNITSFISLDEIKALVFIIERGLQSITAETILKEKLRNFCQSHKIFCHFPQPETVTINGALKESKPKVKQGECIALINAVPMIMCRIVRRTGKFYPICDVYHFPLSQLSDAKYTILLRHKLKHIIFLPIPKDSKFFKDLGIFDTTDEVRKAFSGIDVSFVKKHLTDAGADAVPGMVRYLMDGKVPEYMIKYFCNTEFTVSSLIKCTNGDDLPFEKSVIHTVKKNNFLKVSVF
uniref:Uncharacterized protein n=1 Tax=Panagrolaimus davidi TaxID=227884 RepID=A0A914QLZ7_9BILA